MSGHGNQVQRIPNSQIAIASGGFFDLANPVATDVNFFGIAASLSKLCRFTGHVNRFYSVAQHSLLVADNVSHEARPYGRRITKPNHLPKSQRFRGHQHHYKRTIIAMDETPNLALPYIASAQAQKHVTHNEAIRALDSLVQLSVLDKDLATPPGSPGEGDRYIIATSPTGDWSGNAGQIAAFQDGAWLFYPPVQGWSAYVADESTIYIHNGTTWASYTPSITPTTALILNATPNAAQTVYGILEEELALSGSFVDSTIQIPDRAIVFSVSVYITDTITGATSYDCGISGETSKYGGSLGVDTGSNNSGVTGPTAFYSDTAIRITSNGGAFTGGTVRVAIHYISCVPPTS